MHGLIRTYARGIEPLAVQEIADSYQRLGQYLIRYAEGLSDDDFVSMIEVMEAEQANIAAVLDWCIDGPDARLGISLAWNLYNYWYKTGQFALGKTWLARSASCPTARPATPRIAAWPSTRKVTTPTNLASTRKRCSSTQRPWTYVRADGDEEGVAGAS